MRNETERGDSVRYSEQEDMEVIVSVTGSDNELIIVTLSEIINRFNGRLQASRFNRIDKAFNGLFYISINLAYFGPFRACLESLNSERLHFEFSPANSSDNVFSNDKISFEIELYGLRDKVVDVELLRTLANNQLVVDELSRKSYICDKGKKAYKVRLQVSTDYIFDIDEVESELQLLAEKLDVHLVVNFDEEELQEAI
ncbi:hypothetical protein [Kangiella geojedonensis]|uniref:Glycine cleavage system transcriptional repressor n=1 Tax=Kangiella geojedonensis TaxID=914150 RepID=A0A0F6TS39_9GAMM|nr:hypothetical protein [Kangiella geojedonensis]AKE52949.1 hypothetical protein TQ33_2018 [Kangiella geojedonensis]